MTGAVPTEKWLWHRECAGAEEAQVCVNKGAPGARPLLHSREKKAARLPTTHFSTNELLLSSALLRATESGALRRSRKCMPVLKGKGKRERKKRKTVCAQRVCRRAYCLGRIRLCHRRRAPPSQRSSVSAEPQRNTKGRVRQRNTCERIHERCSLPLRTECVWQLTSKICARGR
jgi:hypothetical protein